MWRRGDPWRAAALALVVGHLVGCSGTKTASVEVGHHRVRFVLPKGWEHLDHGRQHLFRRGENQIQLVDLGPGTAEAMVAELRAAENLWRAGRRKDALQRVRALRGPALRFASRGQRSDFWRRWTDVTYAPDRTDSLAIGGAFSALIAGIDSLPAVPPESLADYVLFPPSTTPRKEVARRTPRTIHGTEWVDFELWDLVSHMNRARFAFAVNGGYLLALSTDHGRFEDSEAAFEALLTSFEVTEAGRTP